MSSSDPHIAYSTTESSAGHSSFASLDLLRGLSAGAVLLSHIDTFVSGGKSLLPGFLGVTAVEIFMLISGFLMMWNFQARRAQGELWGNRSTYSKFYIRRFFRIAPLYYLMLIIVYLFHEPLSYMAGQNLTSFAPTYVPGPHDPTNGALSIGHVLAHFSFLFGFIPQYAQSNPLPDWSIGLEMQFYLVFPFLAMFLVRSGYFAATLAVILVSWMSLQLFGVGVTSEPKLLGLFPYPTFLPFRIDCFLVGMLLATGLFEEKHRSLRVFVFVLALMVAGLHTKKLLIVSVGFLIYELALRDGTGVPLIDRTCRCINHYLRHRFVKFLADTSYGVYLLHIPLLILFIWLVTYYTSFESLSPLVRVLNMILIITPLVYFLSFLAFKYVESPGIEWGRKIVKRL